MIEVVGKYGVDKIPILKSNEMLIDNCYGIYCAIYLNENSTDSSFLYRIFNLTKKIKGFNYRIGIIKLNSNIKKSLNIQHSNEILLVLNLKLKEFLIYNQTKIEDELLKEWFNSMSKLKFEKFEKLNLTNE